MWETREGRRSPPQSSSPHPTERRRESPLPLCSSGACSRRRCRRHLRLQRRRFGAASTFTGPPLPPPPPSPAHRFRRRLHLHRFLRLSEAPLGAVAVSASAALPSSVAAGPPPPPSPSLSSRRSSALALDRPRMPPSPTGFSADLCFFSRKGGDHAIPARSRLGRSAIGGEFGARRGKQDPGRSHRQIRRPQGLVFLLFFRRQRRPKSWFGGRY